MARHLEEHVRGELAAIGELDAFRPAVGAGLNDLCADIDVGMIENRDHPLVDHCSQNAQAIDGHCLLLLFIDA
jgi:hypothetical protein